MKYRVVLVGAGKVGAGYTEDPVMARHYPYATHAQVLAAHPRLEWGAIVDRSEEVLARSRERWGVAITDTKVAGEVAAYRPEIAVLATPPGERADALAAMPSSLRAVIVEKPLGATSAEAAAFVDACRQRSVLVQVNYWRRADRALRDVAARMGEQVGRVQSGLALYGNGLRNNGSHLVDLLRMLVGEPEVVQAAPVPVAVNVGPTGDDVHVSALLHWHGGTTVALAPLDFSRYRENGVDLWGTHGRLTVLQEGLRIATYRCEPNRGMQGEWEIATDAPSYLAPTAGRAFLDLYDDVVAALDTGAPVVSDASSALRTARVVELVLQSMREGGCPLRVDA